MSQQQHSSHDARLDAQTAQQIIARAADLQQAHLETVSPDQLEALAAEVGIRPEFVRRALTESSPTRTAVRTVRRRRRRIELTPLTARDIAGALLPGFCYAVFAALVMASLRNYDTRRLELLLALLQPALLAIYFSWIQPHRRMGALAGFALGFGAVLGVALTNGPYGGIHPVFAFVFGPMLAVAGGVLATIRKWWVELRADETLPLDEAERA